jgi:glycine/D-amino acid oxidase-like deaminating enzyme
MDNDLQFLRQVDAINMARLTRLHVSLIGAGSIGSTTALFLIKMGVGGVQVFDADCVASHNWSNQMYASEHVGKLKVEALKDVIAVFGGNGVDGIGERYADQPLSEVVISAVDSMESRKAIWKSVRQQPEVRLYLDARMGLETLAVYAVRPQLFEDRKLYAGSLYADDEALQEPCTARSVCYTPLMAASVVCNLVKSYVNGEVLDFVTWSLVV